MKNLLKAFFSQNVKEESKVIVRNRLPDSFCRCFLIRIRILTNIYFFKLKFDGIIRFFVELRLVRL